MTHRVSKRDVEAAFARFSRIAAPLLGEGETFVLSYGSPTNGHAWRLHKRTNDSYGLRSVSFLTDYLGWTAKEAEDRLHALSDGMELERERNGSR